MMINYFKPMTKKILEIKAWKELLDLNMQVYLLTILFCIIITKSYNYGVAAEITILISLLSLYLVYTFLVNDYCDMPFDIKAGKKRAIHEMPKIVPLGMLIFFVFLSVILTLLLIFWNSKPLSEGLSEGLSKYGIFVLLYGTAYFLATVYSAFPVRLKSRGSLGIIDDVLIEKTLPVLLIFSFFEYYNLETLLLVVLFSLLQLKIIVEHQILDYEADLKTEVHTFVVKVGVKKASSLLNAVRVFVLLFFLLFAITLLLKIPFSVIILAPLFIGYFVMKKLVAEGKVEKQAARQDLNVPKEWIDRVPLYDGYIVSSMNIVSLFLALFLAFKSYPFTAYGSALPAFLIALVLISQYYLIRNIYIPLTKTVISC